MAKSTQAPTETRPLDRSLKKLVELLDHNQPYEEFERLGCPDLEINDNDKLLRIQGSLVGLAIGDALGASVEFRPYSYLQQYKVKDMQDGGTWGLKAGQWTDDTSMALCLAASLIVKEESDPYDQFIRYKRWYKHGYLSSTGLCFDIGKSTRQAIVEFENRQKNVLRRLIEKNPACKDTPLDKISKQDFLHYYQLECGPSDSAGNGSLMRLAPIPLFYSSASYEMVKNYVEEATKLTHNDQRAIEACQFYAGLIWYALNGTPKEELLDRDFHRNVLKLNLHGDVLRVADGSYKIKSGYEDGIRGKGYVVNSLEAALWVFYNDSGSFNKGVLLAVNLGDDTDTTAAIYGELAGTVYGIHAISPKWVKKLFQEKFIKTVAKALYFRGQQFKNGQQIADEPSEDNTNRRRRNANNQGPSDPKSGDTNRSRPTEKGNANSTLNQGQSTTSYTTSSHAQAVNTYNSSHQGEPRDANNTRDDNRPRNLINEH
ncbi:unnamed protein product [Rotaria sp. Silwood1]|nr:unnamed protein product [Rotaria sp. Silwood1]